MDSGATIDHARPSLIRLAAFILLCLFFIACALLMKDCSGVIFPFQATLIFGLFLFLIQYRSSAGTRGSLFYLFAAVLFLYIFWEFSRNLRLSGYQDRHAGWMLLAASLVAWAGFWLTLYRRWRLPLFRLIFAVAILLWGLDFYVIAVHHPIRHYPVVKTPVYQPLVFAWSMEGRGFFINENDEINTQGILHLFDLESQLQQELKFPGIVSQVRVSPDGHTMAVVYEDKAKQHHLELMDPLGHLRQEIFTSPRGIYFPFRHTQSPWSPSGQWALFSDTAYGQSDLWLYDRGSNQTQHLASGEGVDRAFWLDHRHIAVPRGTERSHESLPVIHHLDVISASDGEKVEERLLDRPYDSLYADADSGVLALRQNAGHAYLAELDFEQGTVFPAKHFSYLDLAFSPDGRRLAYAENPRWKKSWWGNAQDTDATRRFGSRLMVYDRESGEAHILYRSLLGSIGSIAWSSSGRWIAFSLRTDSWLTNGASVVVVSTETGKSYKVASQHPQAVVDFYRNIGRKHLFWRPGREELLFWNVVEDGHDKTTTYSLVHCP